MRSMEAFIKENNPDLESFENVDESKFVFGWISRGNVERRKHAFTRKRDVFKAHFDFTVA